MASRKRSISNDADMQALYKEWDDASCAICMEHPHNAVLLLCSSHDKGCLSYICDTSYRHSNCLDRFKKLKSEDSDSSSPPGSVTGNQDDTIRTSGRNLGFRRSSNLTETIGNNILNGTDIAATVAGSRGNTIYNAASHSAVPLEVIPEETNVENSTDSTLKLKCPLCRGDILGWKVVEEARKYLNLKPRSCSRESCSFIGSYGELRRHARRVHPTIRPADIDPSRQRAWRRLENQREYDDIVSAIRSAVPGAIVLGDYVIEHGDRLSGDRERGPSENGRWLSTFFLFQMIGSMDRMAELRSGRSRALARHRRSTGSYSRRRYLWGENLLGLQEEEEEDEDDDDEEDDEEEESNVPDLNLLSDLGDNDPPNPRRRRRLTRARSDEDLS